MFLKVLGILKPFFQEGFKPPEAALPLPDKPKFENTRNIALRVFGYQSITNVPKNSGRWKSGFSVPTGLHIP